MAELAAAEGSNAKAEAIATRQGISLKFLLDIFRDLKRGELVRSKRGPDGGFTLSRPPEQISLADIFRAVDGPLADVHDESLRDLRYDGAAEALPEVWMAIRGSLRRVLETVIARRPDRRRPAARGRRPGRRVPPQHRRTPWHLALTAAHGRGDRIARRRTRSGARCGAGGVGSCAGVRRAGCWQDTPSPRATPARSPSPTSPPRRWCAPSSPTASARST